MSRQPDLFEALTPACGECPNLGDAIDSGIRYCRGDMTWRWASEHVDGCRYRGRAIAQWKPAEISRTECIRDLLESQRHNIDDKGRAWLRAELRQEQRAISSQAVAA